MAKNFEIALVDRCVEITIDISRLVKNDEIYFNATELAKLFGKKPKDYLRLPSTQEYAEALADDLKVRKSHLKKIKKGKYGGTWLHHELALDFAMWLSPQFKVKLLRLTKQMLKDAAKWRIERLTAKTGYHKLTEAIEKAHNPAKFYHYANESDMLNRIVFGMTSKQCRERYGCIPRDMASAWQLDILTKMQQMNMCMIDMDTPYEERKEKLQQLFDACKAKDFMELTENDTEVIPIETAQ